MPKSTPPPPNAYVTSVLERWKDEKSDTKAIVDEIYQLAISRDVNGLANLVGRGVSVNTFCSVYNAASLLAMTNKIKEVELLIIYFAGDTESAIFGAALAGNVGFVTHLINRHYYYPVYCSVAVYGYMLGGHVEAAETMLWKEVDIGQKVKALAQLGEHEKVRSYLTVDSSLDAALAGYALVGNYKKILELQPGATTGLIYQAAGSVGEVQKIIPLMSSSASNYPFTSTDQYIKALAKAGYFTHLKNYFKNDFTRCNSNLIVGYLEGNHMREFNAKFVPWNIHLIDTISQKINYKIITGTESRLWTATFCDDPNLRAQLTVHERATRIRAVMEKYQINFYEAEILFNKGILGWFTQIIRHLLLLLPIEIIQEITVNLFGDLKFYNVPQLLNTCEGLIARDYEKQYHKRHSIFSYVEKTPQQDPVPNTLTPHK